MGGFFGCCNTASSSSSSGATLGTRLAFASPAGGAVAAAPAGFSTATGILSVTLAAGNATWASLTAGAAGQLLEIRNDDAVNTLTLPASAWGGPGDLALGPGGKVLTYMDGTLATWQTVSP